MNRRPQTWLRILSLTFGIVVIVAAGTVGNTNASEQSDHLVAGGPSISGYVQAGLRVLSIDPGDDNPCFTIYRGDYVRLETTDGGPVTITIPELKVAKTFPPAKGEKAYFKVPNTGKFALTVGGKAGLIEAIEYRTSGYEEIGAAEGSALLANISPFILDVRTPGEFATGHIAGAVLIPVQVLQARIKELDGRQDQPLFVYCRSGNRSTVAANILMTAGFEKVVNLRGGMNEWVGMGLPVVK